MNKSKQVVLFYSQPTIERGERVDGTIWFVTHAPGDGGVDFAYSRNPSDAAALPRKWWKRFRETHGTRAQMRDA